MDNYTTFMQNTLKKVQKKAYDIARKDAVVAAKNWKNYIVTEMAKPKHGNVLQLPGGGTYVASAPGEWPAIKTGNLVECLSVTVSSYNPSSSIIRVYLNVPKANVPYQEHLETIRPWFQRAKTEFREELQKIMRGNY